MKQGKFIISLDFELMWGVRDKLTIDTYGENIIGVQNVIPKLLNIFETNKIAATFSTVGFLFFKNKNELIKSLPKSLPTYIDQNLSPYYQYINSLTNNNSDKHHFANDLIQLIKQCPNQEIGTHTFCHYYCLEPGQTLANFEQDIISAVNIGKQHDIKIQSLVFPRNQINAAYLSSCKKHGLICYRGNEKSWLFTPKNGKDETPLRRALRLLDAYINISGSNTYDVPANSLADEPINLPSSRFLRPYSKWLKYFEFLRLARIKNAMTVAAKNNQVFHLWWHPHNFGINQKENFIFLQKIINHFNYLSKKYNFQSITMSNLAVEILDGAE
jgi:hypothetical protein